MGGACNRYGGEGEVYTGFCWRNLTTKRTRGKARRRCENNIKTDLQEVGCGRGLDSSGS